MSKKKAQHNGFYYFMKDMMPQLKQSGYNFHNGMQDIVPIAHPKWKALSQSERDEYEERAKKEKARIRGSENDKYRMDNTRTLISQRRDPNDEMRRAVKDQRTYRSAVLTWRPGPSLQHEKLYFVDFTSMCRREDTEQWIPLEMSVVEYTMKDGILRTLHKFINPGDIPLGYRFECQNKADTVHQIPIEGFTLAVSDYLHLWHSLENFLVPNQNQEVPPMYTVEHKIEEIKGCILWLAEHSHVGYARCARLRVHHIESMVQDLFRNADQDNPPVEASIYDMLTTTQFDYQKDVVCGYHEELDCRHCSLGRVKIYCFAISDAMAPLYNITLTSKHLPKVSGDIGVVIEPKPIPLERNLRQQVQPAFRGRGGARGRGFMAQPDENRETFAARDVRTKREEQFVPDRESFEDEFTAAAPPLAQMRQPANSGIAASMPCAASVLRDKTAVRLNGSPWQTTPEVPKSYEQDFPPLRREGAAAKAMGRGMMLAREINLGRGKYTWGLAQPPGSTATAFAGAGRGRGGVTSNTTTPVVSFAEHTTIKQ